MSGGSGTDDINEGVDWYLNTKKLVDRAIKVKEKKIEPISQFEEIYSKSSNSALSGKIVSNALIKPFVVLGGARVIYEISCIAANKHYNRIRKLI